MSDDSNNPVADDVVMRLADSEESSGLHASWVGDQSGARTPPGWEISVDVTGGELSPEVKQLMVQAMGILNEQLWREHGAREQEAEGRG